MHQYPEEWKQCKNASEYQTLVAGLLRQIFGEDQVKVEWNSSAHDLHRGQHKTFYFPRIDIAIGPFNSGMHRDVGIDNTAVMKAHPLFKKVNDRNPIGWNDLSRCFLAIEIAFSGSAKHVLGDLANASWNGSIGFIVARQGFPYRRASKMVRYFDASSNSDDAPLHNLRVFREDDFLQFLWELLNPEKEKKLVTEGEYRIPFGRILRRSFVIKAYVTSDTAEDEVDDHIKNTCAILNISAKRVLATHHLQLSARKFLIPATGAMVYELETRDGKIARIMEILDIAADAKHKNCGIESQVLKIFRSIARANDCQFILSDLADNARYDSLDRQVAYFSENGFEVFRNERSRFSGWVAVSGAQKLAQNQASS